MRQPPLTKTELKVILNELITPRLNSIGLTKYDGGYYWFSEFNKLGIKRVFHYQLMKGETGTFTYGNCFEFIPTYNGSGKIINHRTDKSTRTHITEMTEGWRNSFSGGKFTDRTSHWGEEECRNSIANLLSKYLPIMTNWWTENETYEQNIKTAENQTKIGGGYRIIHPRANYFKAFLLAKCGDKNNAIEIIEQELESLVKHKPKFEELKTKIIDRINKY